MRTAYMSLDGDNGWSGFEMVQRLRREGMKSNEIAEIAMGLMRIVSHYESRRPGGAPINLDIVNALDGAISDLQHAWREINGLNDDP